MRWSFALWLSAVTGPTWEVNGRATAGSLAGERLEPIADEYIAFWFGWAAFQPETIIWSEETE